MNGAESAEMRKAVTLATALAGAHSLRGVGHGPLVLVGVDGEGSTEFALMPLGLGAFARPCVRRSIPDFEPVMPAFRMRRTHAQGSFARLSSCRSRSIVSLKRLTAICRRLTCEARLDVRHEHVVRLTGFDADRPE
jgi:hypothetical protein